MINAFRNKHVLVTGHTGFKGSWLVEYLHLLGASTVGLSIDNGIPERAGMGVPHIPVTHDMTDFWPVSELFDELGFDYVFHLAAQALVKTGLTDPLGTIQTNVMATTNLLEAIRISGQKPAVVIVTSDKVYRPSGQACIEEDPLGGPDPYSASKAAADIIAQCYAKTYHMNVCTARAGNVIGGGDYAANRLVPDCWRAVQSGKPLELRRPSAIRPWQHVLDCLTGYLQLASAMQNSIGFPCGPVNLAPETGATAQQVVDLLQNYWQFKTTLDKERFPETEKLVLCSRFAKTYLDWQPKLSWEKAVNWTAWWYENSRKDCDPHEITTTQLVDYIKML